MLIIKVNLVFSFLPQEETRKVMCDLVFFKLDFCWIEETDLFWLKISVTPLLKKKLKQKRSIYISLYALAVQINPSFPCQWFQMAETTAICLSRRLFCLMPYCAGVSWLAHRCSLVCPPWILFSSLGFNRSWWMKRSVAEGRSVAGEAACSQCMQWAAPVPGSADSSASEQLSAVGCWISEFTLLILVFQVWTTFLLTMSQKS